MSGQVCCCENMCAAIFLLVDFQDFCLKKMDRRVEIKKVTKNYPNNIGSVGQNKKKDTKGPHRTSEQQ